MGICVKCKHRTIGDEALCRLCQARSDEEDNRGYVVPAGTFTRKPTMRYVESDTVVVLLRAKGGQRGQDEASPGQENAIRALEGD
jgi:hypothetical protein